jgi:hypothetical protein
MTANDGLDATYALFQAVRCITQNNIAGDMAECGVWRGGSMMLIAYALQNFNDTSRQIYLYDTYAGMTEPDDIDIDFDDKAQKPIWAAITNRGRVMGFGGSVLVSRRTAGH